jgi:hypothetical protein
VTDPWHSHGARVTLPPLPAPPAVAGPATATPGRGRDGRVPFPGAGRQRPRPFPGTGLQAPGSSTSQAAPGRRLRGGGPSGGRNFLGSASGLSLLLGHRVDKDRQ